MTFTLTQPQPGEDIYIYPSGDLSGCTAFTAVGDNPNYKCVDDDRLSPDDDTTYVYYAGASVATDLYELPNQSLSGTINYIQVYTRVKSDPIAQKVNGIFKIVCSPDSICTHVYSSEDKDLTTDYQTYDYVWNTNPATSNAWSWANVDALCIGIAANSPTIGGAELSLTLRPNAVGNKAECTPVGDNPNYKCVDEAVADDDTTYVWSNHAGGDQEDLHNIPNHTTESGTITMVTIFTRYNGSIVSGIQTKVVTHGVEYFWGHGAMFSILTLIQVLLGHGLK
jgi:hypothetical protein